MREHLTDDLFFGGRLRLLQPRRGHRFGGDAALLAAAARSRLEDATTVADLGAGVGAVGLALAACGAGRSLLVEIDDALCDLGRENARRNGVEDRVASVCADVADLGGPDGPADVSPDAFGLVVMNPPFDDGRRYRASPDAAKARAHLDASGAMDVWIAAAARLIAPGASLVMIHRPEAMGALLAALEGRFGDIRIRPVHASAAEPAGRILLAARKERRGALALLPPFMMHGPDGRFTEAADAAQRGRAPIDMA